jgi:2-polyprenyl-3-methyl-5-hydroxy-6-metoxy-1,4-benzoquinol methylase
VAKLTGERPLQGVTPDSLLALHAAGYREVISRLGPGTLLDIGCGQGYESVRMASAGRSVVGADYDVDTMRQAGRRWGAEGLRLSAMDATRLGFGNATFDWVCSSHLIEHFVEPEGHAEEIARVLRPEGTAFVLTPNAPADFENPFHLHLFDRDDLLKMLDRHFESVWVGGLDARPHVKEDFEQRRAKAKRVLALDVFRLRHKLPRSWYIAAYTHLLPVAYRLMARSDTGGRARIDADDFFVTDDVDDTTLVLFAMARGPRTAAPEHVRHDADADEVVELVPA